jgi:four helix bundle protein
MHGISEVISRPQCLPSSFGWERRHFSIEQTFPRSEQYSFTDQVRRSSRAVNAMVAEAWARRRYRAAFVDKINQALGEAMETQAWLDHGFRCGYISAENLRQHDEIWQKIGGMLARMIDKADDFCGPNKRSPSSPSTTNHPPSTLR